MEFDTCTWSQTGRQAGTHAGTHTHTCTLKHRGGRKGERHREPGKKTLLTRLVKEGDTKQRMKLTRDVWSTLKGWRRGGSMGAIPVSGKPHRPNLHWQRHSHMQK